MPSPRILLADNSESYLETCAEYIALAGYEVEKAHDPAGARRIIEDGRVHLAVLDVRLTSDDDEKDFSGLTLAKETSTSVPKIMLTAYQTWESVREALGTVDTEVPPAVYFVAKQEGLACLLAHIEQALAKYARLNWDLVIDWRVHDQFSLVRFMEPELEGERLLRRSEEFEDLFRALFYDKEHVIVSRSLWQREGGAAFVIFSFGGSAPDEAHVVVCGRRAEAEEAARRRVRFGPHAPGYNATVLDRTGVTQHFAANSFSLAGADLEHVVSLHDMYRTASERSFASAVTGLLQQTLGEWHQGKRVADESLTLGDAYRRRLGMSGGEAQRAALEERVSFLVRQIPTLGVEARRSSGKLSLLLGGETYTYPDPVSAFGEGFNAGGVTLLIKTPGMFTGADVLADSEGRTWLTDFSKAGMSPVLWNYVTLEAAVRFDWVEVNNLQWLHGLEQQLTASDFSKLFTADIEPPLRKTARTVALIRKLASRDVNKNYAAYHAGVLFHALQRLMCSDPETPLTKNELIRLTHLLLAAAMVYDRLTRASSGAEAGKDQSRAGIRVNGQKEEVWVNGARVPLRGQSYELLLDLYEHANEVRTRRALIERVFAEEYDEHDESQVSRLNTAIRRLREKIEDDPDRPRFLLTEPHSGYRLVVRPK